LQLIPVLCRPWRFVAVTAPMTFRQFGRLLWKAYTRCAIVGIVVGGIGSLAGTLVDGFPLEPFFSLTLPTVAAVCLVISLPAAVIAVVAITILRRHYPKASRSHLASVGRLVGALVPVASILPVATWEPLSSHFGIVFWGSFLLAGALAGRWIGMASNGWIQETQ